MSFVSSLRPSRAIARSGILLSTLLALGSLVVPAFAQMGGSMTSGYDADSPYGSGAQQAQKGLVNIPSGIQRPGNYSSNNAIKALLYQDASAVLHVCLNKIDYESLSSFVNEIVDKGAGSVRSDDKYRVQLREFQKTDLQNSFQSLLSSLQSTITQSTFKKNIDEFYCVKYVSSDPKKMGCVVLAIPTAGLSDDQVCDVMDFLGEKNYVLTIFTRYGFVIAVVAHDSAIPLDLDEIDAKYQERMEKSVEAEYGSYAAGSSSDYRASDSSNSQKNSLTALSQDYLNEVKEAQESNKTASRKEVLPRVRNRFNSPATEDEAKTLSEGLQLGEGCAVTICVKNLDSIKDLLVSSEATADLPFAGLGSASDDSSATSTLDLESLSKMLSVKGDSSAALPKCDAVTVAVSLVGSPKVALIQSFDQEESAKAFSTAADAALTLAKPMLLKTINEAVASAATSEPVDFSALVDEIFKNLKPQTSGNKVAVVLNLEPLKTNASIFMPLMGAVETKSEKEAESDEIDWSLGEETSSANTDSAPVDSVPAADSTQNVDDSSSENSSSEDLDSIFDDSEEETDDQEEEEDPFA
ncbi:MAG: hypothetical protein KIG81_01140 [Thermoguttaceae bacterium]|nr:hypothetical protein [Thermoguttaceae bacterium]